jgi:hypothetical protein
MSPHPLSTADTALLAAVRAWFDAWGMADGRLSASQATSLPEFRPLLTAMCEDADERTPIDDPGHLATCDPAFQPELVT